MNVKPNQSFLDVILQGCGTMEAGMQVSADNGLPISYLPEVNSDIAISATASVMGDSGVLKYLGNNNITIGTKALSGVVTLVSDDDSTEPLVSDDGSSVLIPD